MPGTAITKSVVANEPGGRKREEIFVDIIEKISITFSSSVSFLLWFWNFDSLTFLLQQYAGMKKYVLTRYMKSETDKCTGNKCWVVEPKPLYAFGIVFLWEDIIRDG